MPNRRVPCFSDGKRSVSCWRGSRLHIDDTPSFEIRRIMSGIMSMVYFEVISVCIMAGKVMEYIVTINPLLSNALVCE